MDQHVENLALVIHGTPPIHPLTGDARSITDPIKEQLANAIINDACFHPGIMRVCRVDLDVVTGKTAGALSRGIVQRSGRTVD